MAHALALGAHWMLHLIGHVNISTSLERTMEAKANKNKGAMKALVRQKYPGFRVTTEKPVLGGFSLVYTASNAKTAEKIAVKHMNYRDDSTRHEVFCREVDMLMAVRGSGKFRRWHDD